MKMKEQTIETLKTIAGNDWGWICDVGFAKTKREAERAKKFAEKILRTKSLRP